MYIFCLFLAALGLCCFVRAVSSCGMQASHCRGFSGCRAQAPGAQFSVVSAHGLSSFGSQAQQLWHMSLHSMWNLPGPGVNPCPLHWQVDYYPLHHQESPRSFTLLNSNHNHISQHYCHNYTQYLFWHSHLLYEVNTIISPISQMKTMRPARLTCPQSFFQHKFIEHLLCDKHC